MNTDKLRESLSKSRSGSHILRLVAGGYLLYLSYGFFFDSTEKAKGVYIFAVLFTIIGLFLTLLSAYALHKGYFLEQVQADLADTEENSDLLEEEISERTNEEK